MLQEKASGRETDPVIPHVDLSSRDTVGGGGRRTAGMHVRAHARTHARTPATHAGFVYKCRLPEFLDSESE